MAGVDSGRPATLNRAVYESRESELNSVTPVSFADADVLDADGLGPVGSALTGGANRGAGADRSRRFAAVT